ncbi:MAG: peptidase E [Pirellulaceae bacterium]|nr:peptidase E [Pirellulaceae bacterium]
MTNRRRFLGGLAAGGLAASGLGVGAKFPFLSTASAAASSPSGMQKEVQKNIIAIGGAGLNWKRDRLLLTRYAFSLSGKKNPRVCLLPTATGDSLRTIVNYYEAVNNLICRPEHLRIYSPHVTDFADYLLSFDVIYVGGGNTLNMLAIWREQGIVDILREAWEKGIVLLGSSAGSICWFEQGSTDSRPGRLTAMKCMGFLEGSNCPHYSSERARRSTYHRMIKDGRLKNGLAADDGCGLHYQETKLHKVISSRPRAMAYSVKKESDYIVETPLQPEYLGDKKSLQTAYIDS